MTVSAEAIETDNYNTYGYKSNKTGFSFLTNSNIEKSVESFIGKNFSEFKEKLSEVLVDKIEPISLEIKKLLKLIFHYLYLSF